MHALPSRYDAAIEPLEPWEDVLVGKTRKDVLRAVQRAYRRGELAAVGRLQPLPGHRWGVRVLRLREASPERRWVRPVVVAGSSVVVLGGAATAGWWLVASTAAAMAAVSLPVVLVLAALTWLISRAASGGGCRTTITITHKH